MTRLRIFGATVVVAAVAGIGGLASPPSASALPNRGLCGSLMVRYQVSLIWGQIYEGAGEPAMAAVYYAQAAAYLDAANDCNRQL
jgi:hypothetical protein